MVNAAYFVGDGGTNLYASVNCWSETSGGPGGYGLPRYNAYFDNNSPNCLILDGITHLVSNVDTTGYTGVFTIDTGSLQINDSLNLIDGTIRLIPRAANNFISFGNCVISGTLEFTKPSTGITEVRSWGDLTVDSPSCIISNNETWRMWEPASAIIDFGGASIYNLNIYGIDRNIVGDIIVTNTLTMSPLSIFTTSSGITIETQNIDMVGAVDEYITLQGFSTWYLVCHNPSPVSYVRVSHSDASGSDSPIIANDGTNENLHYNTNWVFPPVQGLGDLVSYLPVFGKVPRCQGAGELLINHIETEPSKDAEIYFDIKNQTTLDRYINSEGKMFFRARIAEGRTYPIYKVSDNVDGFKSGNPWTSSVSVNPSLIGKTEAVKVLGLDYFRVESL